MRQLFCWLINTPETVRKMRCGVSLLGSGAITHAHTHTEEAAIQHHHGGAGKPTGPCTATREACSPSTMGRAPSGNDRLEPETWERAPTSARSPRASPRGSRAPAMVLETSGPTTCDFPCCLTGQSANDRKGTEEKAKKIK